MVRRGRRTGWSRSPPLDPAETNFHPNPLIQCILQKSGKMGQGSASQVPEREGANHGRLGARAAARPGIMQLAHDTRAGSPLLWKWALAFFGLFALTYAGTFVDHRLLNGVSVWEKPAKFFL